MNISFYERLKSEISLEKPVMLNEMKSVYILTLEDGIVSGLEEAYNFIQFVDADLEVRAHKIDGKEMKRGEVLLSIVGMTHKTFKLAKVLMRLISRMSGVATISHYYKEHLAPTELLDAHFYTPGLKEIEKVALSHGGVSELDFKLISKEEIHGLGGLKKAYEKMHLIEDVFCYEITDLRDFYDAQELNIHFLMLTGFNFDALRRMSLDNQKDITLIPQGIYQPSQLESLQTLGFKYLETSILTKAARSIELAMTFSE